MRHFSKPQEILTFVIAITIISSCSTSFHKSESEAPSSTEIIPFVGIGNVVLGKSLVSDVQKEFGKGIKRRHLVQLLDLGELYMERTIDYPQSGILFRASHISSSPGLVVEAIDMDSSCKFKTKMGNGIGSTLNDLRREFGSLDIVFWRGPENDKDKNWVDVFLYDANGSMRFICHNMDTTQYKVESIRMDY